MAKSPKLTSELVQQSKHLLKNHYGARLENVILYGSVSRQEHDAQSDIDLLVILSQPFDYFEELRQIIDLLYPIQLESTYLISARPVLAHEYEAGAIQLYRNAKREGIAV
ncbi:MAG: nucleotidyltransferase domain-containing protein [Ardenticatenaceae bacterium]|nr:nucleotidyltransferase domain-containing protein [Anaerolineales bacterium]MCB8939809.1 nucleotidyltransferase domain-containing protein [Ardenticatenaceae bacterium]MCB8975107.1 nucleotidyltransferase domain-containing protein [Ardenticatenaceae bacterium]